MKIEAAFHTIRAVRNVIKDDARIRKVHDTKNLLVIGSQAVLGHMLDKDFDFQFDESIEIDITPLPDDEYLSDLIDGTLGEMSLFHETHSYYVHGINSFTAIMPEGWKDRLLPIPIEDYTVYFPSLEDIAISKYVSHREKDMRFIKKMWQEDLLNKYTLSLLAETLPKDIIGEEQYDYIMKLIQNDIDKYCPEGPK